MNHKRIHIYKKDKIYKRAEIKLKDKIYKLFDNGEYTFIKLNRNTIKKIKQDIYYTTEQLENIMNIQTELKNQKFKIEKEVTTQLISDMLITAIESSISYWCGSISSNFNNYKSDIPYYANCFDQNWSIIIKPHDEDFITLNIQSIQNGLNLMANKQPKHFFNMINDDYDAQTADVFFQYVALGELVYG